jgi:hypothetical protein
MLGHLHLAFIADDALEVAHQHGIRVRAGRRAEDVEGRFDVGHPVAHGLVQGILEGLRAGFDADHGGAEQFHAIDVGRLALDVLGAHVDDTFHAVARRHGRGGDAMLAGAGLGDDPLLAHAPGQQGLTDGVVDLVRAGVIEVFALQVDLGAAEDFRPAPGVVDRAGPADVVAQFVAEFGLKIRVVPGRFIFARQFVERRHERLGDINAAVWAEMAARIGQVIHLHCVLPS